MSKFDSINSRYVTNVPVVRTMSPQVATPNITASPAFSIQSNNANSLSAQFQKPKNYSFERNPSYSQLSDIEAAILRSNVPMNISETEEISVLGQRGIWMNKQEEINWKGPLPLNEYKINEDPNPEIITKKAQQNVIYIQELAIRYLKPPSPPTPGDIVITQEPNLISNPAPPLIIRQQPPRPTTPDPLVIREAPPIPPKQVGRKVITISGKRLPPPPRKVVIERLAPLPSKPQSVIIERWLPYSQVKRRVIYQKSSENDSIVVKPRNVIVQWEAPSVTIKKDFKYLGIIRANPVEYVKRYGPTLKSSNELPDFVLEIKPPSGVILAADYQYNQAHELEGDVQALGLVDLDREGLGEYKSQLTKLGIGTTASSFLNTNTITATNKNNNNNNNNYLSYNINKSIIETSQTDDSLVNIKSIEDSNSNNSMAYYNKLYSSESFNKNFSLTSALIIISDILAEVDKDNNGKLPVDEAEKLFLKLNSSLGRLCTNEDVKNFFLSINFSKDGYINLRDFRTAFEKSL